MAAAETGHRKFVASDSEPSVGLEAQFKADAICARKAVSQAPSQIVICLTYPAVVRRSHWEHGGSMWLVLAENNLRETVEACSPGVASRLLRRRDYWRLRRKMPLTYMWPK